MTKQFTSDEKWRQLGDGPLIKDYIIEFGQNVYEHQYLPGRVKYGSTLLGDPILNLGEELGDSIAYLAMAKLQQLEIIKQCNEARDTLEKIDGILSLSSGVQGVVTLIKAIINDYLINHVDLRETYLTDIELTRLPAPQD